jgi:hypothetical protein
MSHTAQEAICPLPEGDFFAHFDCPRASTLIWRGVLHVISFYEDL